jgi:ketopantoate reductase
MPDLRILVLGAGGIGGYFGGRLAESGADVTFLVREGRRKSLIEDGLRIESSFGNAALAVRSCGATGGALRLTILCIMYAGVSGNACRRNWSISPRPPP